MDWISKLNQYSKRIAGNRWDAEDLAQDAYLKVLAAVHKDPSKPITKAYLYRVVLNTWIDKQKKHRLDLIPIDSVTLPPSHDSSFLTRELLELLANRLQPRMVVILLLMDVFDFTAKETAKLISAKEATVQVTLGRARKRLKDVAMQPLVDQASFVMEKKASRKETLDFEALVEAFRVRNANAIYNAYVGLSREGIHIRRLRTMDDRLFITFCDPYGNLFTVST